MLRKGQHQQKLSKKEFPFGLDFSTNNRTSRAFSFEFIKFNLVYIVDRFLSIAQRAAIRDLCKWHDLSD